jgi:hypothetical protein
MSGAYTVTSFGQRSLVLCLILLAFSRTGFGADPAKPSVSWRLWHPWLTFAGKGPVKAGDPEASRLVVSQIKRSTTIFRALLDGKIKTDESTQKFWDEVTENLQNLDLDSLYEDFPEGPEKGWRSLRLLGHWTGANYSIKRAKTKKSLVLNVDKGPGVKFLDASLNVQSRPVNEAASYQGRLDLSLGLGQTTVSQMVKVSHDAMVLLESETTLMAERARVRPALKTRQSVKKANIHLDREDTEILACFMETFPKLYGVLERVLEVKDIVRRTTVIQSKTRGLCEFRLTFSFRMETLKKKYPEVWAFLGEVGELIHIEGSLKDRQGRQIGTFYFDTGQRTMRICALIKNGAIIPVDEGGHPILAAALDPAKVRRLDFSIRAKAVFNINGIKLQADRIAMNGDYRRVGEDAMVLTRFKIPPRVSITGQAYGVVPTWLIDVFIPGNIDELARKFLSTMTRGNEGRGMELRTFIHHGETGDTVWSLKQRSELLNNALIRIGFRLMNHKLIPNEDARGEIKSFLKDALGALEADSTAMLKTLKK